MAPGHWMLSVRRFGTTLRRGATFRKNKNRNKQKAISIEQSLFRKLSRTFGPGYLNRYKDSLRAWRSGDRTHVGVKFSAPVQTGPGAHPASYTMGTGYFLAVKRPGRGVDHPPRSSTAVKERVQLYIYFPLEPSCPVMGWTVPLPFSRTSARPELPPILCNPNVDILVYKSLPVFVYPEPDWSNRDILKRYLRNINKRATYCTVTLRFHTGWGISRLTPLHPKMAAVAPMSRISYSFTPNHYILRARCVRHAVRGMKGC